MTVHLSGKILSIICTLTTVPNDRGHAVFAAKIIPQVLAILNAGK